MARRTSNIDNSPDDDDDEVVEELSEVTESDQAYCPDCGALIWDAADVCPKCFAYLGGDTSRHPPNRASRKSRLARLVVLLVIIGLLMSTGLALLIRRW